MTTIAVAGPAVLVLHHGVAIRGRAGAIVTVERLDNPPREADSEPAIVTGIERFAYEVAPVLRRVQALKAADPACSVVVDLEGLGDALWALLDSPDHRRGWRLYAKRSVERQELTRELVVAQTRHAFAFAPGLAEAEAMKKAMLMLTRDPREDGPGSELCVALALAIADRRPGVPRIF
jgi:hypothetical protein